MGKDYKRTGILPKKKTTTKEGKAEYMKEYMRRRRKELKKQKHKRTSSKDFRTLMDVILEDPNKPKVKYQNPDRWRG